MAAKGIAPAGSAFDHDETQRSALSTMQRCFRLVVG